MGRWEWHQDLGGWIWVWDNGPQDRGSTPNPSQGQGGYGGQPKPNSLPPPGTPNGTRADAVSGSGPGRWEYHGDLGGWLWVWDNGAQDRGSTPTPTSGQGGYAGQAKPAPPGSPLPNGTRYDPGSAAQAPAPPPTTTSTSQGPSTADNDAQAAINAYLAPFGLQSLGATMYQEYKNGIPMPQIQLDIQNSQEFKSRFPGMADLIAKGHAITPADYVSLERQYTSLFRQAGLPEGFYDTPDDFGKLIGGEVSPTELGKRLDMYSNLVYTADPSAKAFLQQYYGIDDGGILAYAIDPTKALPILQKQFLAASESAAAVRSGFGGLTKGEAEQVANWGIDPQQAAAQFTKLGLDKELFTPIAGESPYSGINREQSIAGYLGGNADAIKAVENERAKRLGAFQGGGQFAATSKGVVGLSNPSN